MRLPVRKLFFKDPIIRTFYITRLHEDEIEEKVFLKQNRQCIDITKHQGMICLDPFCIAVWLNEHDLNLIDPDMVDIRFMKGTKRNASIKVSIIEKIATTQGALLLYKIESIKNY